MATTPTPKVGDTVTYIGSLADYHGFELVVTSTNRATGRMNLRDRIHTTIQLNNVRPESVRR